MYRKMKNGVSIDDIRSRLTMHEIKSLLYWGKCHGAESVSQGVDSFVASKNAGFEYILTNYRWVFIIFFLLPLSLVYDALTYFRSCVLFKLYSAPDKHAEKVRNVQRQVREWAAGGSGMQMCTAPLGAPSWPPAAAVVSRALAALNWAPAVGAKGCIKINMLDVLNVDTQKMVVRVEPQATLSHVMATLLPLGMTLPVVPENDQLTIGGLICGAGVETSSHKRGLMQHVCEAFELVLADGTLERCTKTENPDLFYSVPWSHGTLGFLVAAEIRIVPAAKFVKVTYESVYSTDQIVSRLRAASESKEHDFVEALLFSESEAVLMTGTLSHTCEPGKMNAIGDYYKPWFYLHASTYLARGRCVEYIPFSHYTHRHARAHFWQMQDIISFGNHPLFRYVLGWVMPPKASLLKLMQKETTKCLYTEEQITQDLMIPLDNLATTIKFLDTELNMYPVWLCPFTLPSTPGLVHPRGDAAQMYVNLGVYGAPQVDDYVSAATVKRLEAFVQKVHGFKQLDAACGLSPDEFRAMFDLRLYDDLRMRLNCQPAFPDLYETVMQ